MDKHTKWVSGALLMEISPILFVMVFKSTTAFSDSNAIQMVDDVDLR